MHKSFWMGVAALLCAAQAWAADVIVKDAWIRATAPGQTGAVVQFSITSPQDAYLLGISSSIAAVEMHSMTQEGGVMKMRPLKSLPLPAGRQVDLGSTGNHVMLVNLKQPLKEGDIVPLTFTVLFTDSHREKINVKAEVRPLTATTETHEHHDHH